MPPLKKKKALPRLRPNQKLFLFIWMLFVLLLTFRFFRGTGPRVLLAALVIVPVIGSLVGFRLLDKFDELARKFGFNPAPPLDPMTDPKKHFEAFMGFLKSHQPKGQFTRNDLANFCREREISPDALIRLGQSKGWFQEMGGAMVITSQGEDMLRQFG